MKPNRQLVRRARAAVRAAVRTNPVLRRHYKKPPGLWRRQFHWLNLRWVFAPAFLMGGLGGAPATTLLGFGALWTACVLFSRATRLLAPMTAGESLFVYYQLPVSNETVFRLLAREWLRGSIWLAVDWLALGAGLALREGSPLLAVLAVALGAAQWSAHTALAAWGVHRWPRFPYDLFLGVFGVLFFFCIQSYERAWAQAAFIKPTFQFCLNLTPAGWLTKSYLAAGSGLWIGWVGLLAIGAAAGLLIRPALAALKTRFRMEPLFGYGSSESETAPATAPIAPVPADEEIDFESPGPDLSKLPATDPARIREQLAQLSARPPGHMLAPGVIESAVRQTLSRRQQRVLAQLRPRPPWRWSLGWVWALGGLLFTRLLMLAGLDPVWCGLLACAFTLLALPAFGGVWSGFDEAGTFQYSAGLHAYQPIGYWESSWLMLQVNFVRLAAGAPLLLLTVCFGFEPVPLAWPVAWAYTWKIVLVLIAIQPIWCVVSFSRSTNDSSTRWWFSLFLVLAILGGLFVMVMGGVVLFSLTETVPALAVGGGLIAFCWLLWVCYGLAYRNGVFDLMKLNRPSP